MYWVLYLNRVEDPMRIWGIYLSASTVKNAFLAMKIVSWSILCKVCVSADGTVTVLWGMPRIWFCVC